MRKIKMAGFVAGLTVVLLVASTGSAAATPGVRGAGIYCAQYDAYEVLDCGPDHRLPTGALGDQLGWVFDQLGGGAATLTVEEITEHLTAGHLAARPAEEVLAGMRETLAQAGGPVRLVGYSYPPRADQAMAIAEAEAGLRLGVGIGVAAGRIDLLEVTDPPPTLVPQGRYNGWYDIGGRRLFLRCTGSGSPTVVIDNGLTAHWYPLQNRLSSLTRVCGYDPARQSGPEGRSDPAPAPRSGIDRVNDLHALLAAAQVPGPYVLAGHSNGGLFDLLFASRHPDQVAGLVLIDGVHPSYHPRNVEVLKPFVPPELWPWLAEIVCAILPVQVDYEQMDICTGEAQTRAALVTAPLRPMPLAVLSRHEAQFPPGGPDDAQDKLWSQLQNELAALLPGSRHVIAPTPDHDIQHAHPQFVLDEIAAVVHAVRAGRTTLAEPYDRGMGS